MTAQNYLLKRLVPAIRLLNHSVESSMNVSLLFFIIFHYFSLLNGMALILILGYQFIMSLKLKILSYKIMLRGFTNVLLRPPILLSQLATLPLLLLVPAMISALNSEVRIRSSIVLKYVNQR